MAFLCEPTGPVPLAHWEPWQVDIGKKAAEWALAGIGEPATDKIEQGQITHVVRRLCSDAERRRVVERFAK